MSDNDEARRLRNILANSVTLTEHLATVDKFAYGIGHVTLAERAS